MPSELILNAAAIPFSKKKYTEKEESCAAALFKEISKPSAKIEVVIPETMTPEDFDVAMSVVCKVIVKAHLQTEALMPVLGRLLFIASKNPSLYSEKFDSFSEFQESIQNRFGVSRSTCFEAKAFSERWAEIVPTDQYQAIGRVKMNIISKVTEKGKEGQQKTAKLIEAAKTMTVKELDGYLVEKGYLEGGETSGASFKFPMNKAQHKRATQWYDDARVQAYCGTTDTAKIHDMMIAECSAEWYPTGQEKLDSQDDAESDQAQEAEPAQAEA